MPSTDPLFSHLTELQRDAFTELVNIATGRVALYLEALTNHPIHLTVPEVHLTQLDNLITKLEKKLNSPLALVRQSIAGSITGEVLFLLEFTNAANLNVILTGHPPLQRERFDSSTRDVITEVGNLLLTNCLSLLGEVLDIHVLFFPPRLRFIPYDASINTLQPKKINSDEHIYALITDITFSQDQHVVSSQVVITLNESSLKTLFTAISKYE
ncbi:MAG TPA: hypothetical protein VLL52_08960 [Anaerolineae bacterium]|nr:hypothetical protein [Anaerolineae bacterium]